MDLIVEDQRGVEIARQMHVVQRSEGLQLVATQGGFRLTGRDPNLIRAATFRLGLVGLALGVVRQQRVETILGLPIPVQLPATARRCFGHPVGGPRRGRWSSRDRDRFRGGFGADDRGRGGPDGGRGRDHPVRAAAGVRRLGSGSGRTAIGRRRRAEDFHTVRQRLGFDQAVPGAQRRDERPVDGRLVPLGPSLGQRESRTCWFQARKGRDPKMRSCGSTLRVFLR